MNSETQQDDQVAVLIRCEDCGHMVPELNIAIHKARSCQARARPPTEAPTAAPLQQTGLRQRRGNGQTASTPHNTVPVEKSETEDDIQQVGDIIDLAQDHEEEGEQADADDEHWACPRCTLLNDLTKLRCAACQYSVGDSPNTRAPDPVVRERLIGLDDSPLLPPGINNGSNTQGEIGTYMGGGALLGSLVGAAGAYMRGTPISSSALEGAMSGAVAGGFVHEAMRSTSPPSNRANTQAGTASSRMPRMSVSQARSSSAMGLPAYPSMGSSNATAQNNRQAQPRPSYRVIQRTNRNGVTTTIVSGGGTRVTRIGGSQSDDEMLNFFLQTLAGGGGVQPLMAGAAMQNPDGMSYDQLLEAFGNGTEHLGADEQTILSLPVAQVTDPNQLPEDARQCSICLEDFSQDQARKTLPCLHGFHQGCVDQWLRENGSCPICKHRITD